MTIHRAAFGAVLLCAACAVASELPADMQGAESASMKSESKHADYYTRVVQPFFYEKVMAQCVQISFEDKTPFLIVVALDPTGKVMKVYKEPQTRVTRCLDEKIANIEFPKPPSSPFFAHFDMRFEKGRSVQ